MLISKSVDSFRIDFKLSISDIISKYPIIHKCVTVVPGTVVSLPEDYNTYLNAKYEDEELESDNQKRDDIGAKKVLKQTLNVENGFILQTCDLETRNEAIKKLREKGLSIRQIERLTETNVPGTFVS